jgi:disulfide bond formation protein DsbB
MLSNKNISYMSWTVALISMLISLVFSDILKFPPCTLCWYQRIFMYPLVFIIPVGILSNDDKIHTYTLVLSAVGLVIASYHSMIYHGVIQEALKVCTADLSCKTKQFELFDLISIPVMSLVSFSFIFILNLQGVRNVKRA